MYELPLIFHFSVIHYAQHHHLQLINSAVKAGSVNKETYFYETLDIPSCAYSAWLPDFGYTFHGFPERIDLCISCYLTTLYQLLWLSVRC